MADNRPPTAMPPSSEPFPGSRTPGWNDPPALSYNPLSAAGSGVRPRNSLNKRVAYPLQGVNQVTSTTPTTKPTAVVLPNQSIPPPPPTTSISIMQPVAVVHPFHSTSHQQENITDLPADAAVISFSSLRDRVPLVQESLNVRRDEIERRLGIIEQLWESGNLSEGVKNKIYNLSLAIQRNAYNEAMEIYTTLVAIHANECTTWAVTLRHVVLTVSPPTTNVAANTSTPAASDTGNVTGAISSSGGSNTNLVSTIPTMSVMAMPREIGGNEAGSNTPLTRVQHI